MKWWWRYFWWWDVSMQLAWMNCVFMKCMDLQRDSVFSRCAETCSTTVLFFCILFYFISFRSSWIWSMMSMLYHNGNAAVCWFPFSISVHSEYRIEFRILHTWKCQNEDVAHISYIRTTIRSSLACHHEIDDGKTHKKNLLNTTYTHTHREPLAHNSIITSFNRFIIRG